MVFLCESPRMSPPPSAHGRFASPRARPLRPGRGARALNLDCGLPVPWAAQDWTATGLRCVALNEATLRVPHTCPTDRRKGARLRVRQAQARDVAPSVPVTGASSWARGSAGPGDRTVTLWPQDAQREATRSSVPGLCLTPAPRVGKGSVWPHPPW